MTKIVKSLSVIAFVSAVALAGTGAYFSDEEVSTGNTFTAGAIDLEIDSKCSYNGADCILYATDSENYWDTDGTNTIEADEAYANNRCDCNWTFTDLTNEKFFNFLDIKPGDEGENTISIHIDSNDAWLCMNITTTLDDDVTCTEPEIEYETPAECNDGDGTIGDISLFDGELGENLMVFAWLEEDGNNVYDGEEEEILFDPVMATTAFNMTHTIADSTTGTGPYPAGVQNVYVGMAWCAGDMDLTGTTITCDGDTMKNDCQSDSLVADITFRVEQARNNDSFTCN